MSFIRHPRSEVRLKRMKREDTEDMYGKSCSVGGQNYGRAPGTHEVTARLTKETMRRHEDSRREAEDIKWPTEDRKKPIEDMLRLTEGKKRTTTEDRLRPAKGEDALRRNEDGRWPLNLAGRVEVTADAPHPARLVFVLSTYCTFSSKHSMFFWK